MDQVIKLKQVQKTPNEILGEVVNDISTKTFIDNLKISFDVKDQYDKPSSKWSLSNRYLMVVQGSFDSRGFNQWANIGRFVKKGSKASYILGPNLIDICKNCSSPENKYSWTGIVRLVNGQCMKCKITKRNKPHLVETRLTGFRTIPVFGVEKTEGKALPEFKPTKRPNLSHVADRMNIKIHYKELTGVYGYFYDKDNSITLATENEGVFFHELAHAIDHKLRGDTIHKTKNKTEVIAELTACVLARMYGIEYESQAQKYIQNYTDGKKKKKLALCVCQS